MSALIDAVNLTEPFVESPATNEPEIAQETDLVCPADAVPLLQAPLVAPPVSVHVYEQLYGQLTVPVMVAENDSLSLLRLHPEHDVVTSGSALLVFSK